jgi:hypothetical protein
MQQPCYDEIEGVFRGWLCHHCNLILGHAQDNPGTLRLLADYIERSLLQTAQGDVSSWYQRRGGSAPSA